jgi:hypothetical protein
MVLKAVLGEVWILANAMKKLLQSGYCEIRVVVLTYE